MSPEKKPVPQFKLNYFDIIKGVLFPRMGVPKSQTPAKSPPTASPSKTVAPPPAASSNVPAPAKSAAPPPVVSTSAPLPASQAKTAPPKAGAKPGTRTLPKLQKEKLGDAFFHIAGVISFAVNIILVVVLVILARELFALKTLVGDNLLGGLYGNFILMDQAHIKTNIVVEDKIPVQFDLPISQQITVTLTDNTVIRNAIVGVLSVPTTVTLPAGTQLPIQLDLTVPVSTTIPIRLNVPVDIPLEQTELHKPFVGLQQVVHPLYYILQPQVKSPKDLPCGPFRPFCNWFFYK